MMILTTKIDPKNAPEETGEVLRNHFFDCSKGFGCYQSFDLNFPELERIPVEFPPDWDGMVGDEMWTRCKDQGIEMRYFWEGDGTLMFIFPDGTCLVNSDCKKAYHWKFYENYKSAMGADYVW